MHFSNSLPQFDDLMSVSYEKHNIFLVKKQSEERVDFMYGCDFCNNSSALLRIFLCNISELPCPVDTGSVQFSY